MSHFCLTAGVGLPDCDYRVAGNLLLLLAISEIIPGLAGRIRWLQKCLNVSIMFEKSLLCSLQINITKDITSIVQWVEEFFMIPFFWTLYYCLLYFNSFTILGFNCKYAAGNCIFGVGDGDTGAGYVMCLGLIIKTPERRHWLYCRFWAWLAPCSSVSIVDFQQVNVGWILVILTKRFFFN